MCGFIKTSNQRSSPKWRSIKFDMWSNTCSFCRGVVQSCASTAAVCRSNYSEADFLFLLQVFCCCAQFGFCAAGMTEASEAQRWDQSKASDVGAADWSFWRIYSFSEASNRLEVRREVRRCEAGKGFKPVLCKQEMKKHRRNVLSWTNQKLHSATCC